MNGNVGLLLEKVDAFIKKMGKPFDAWFCLGDMLSNTITGEDRRLLTDLVTGKRSGMHLLHPCTHGAP